MVWTGARRGGSAAGQRGDRVAAPRWTVWGRRAIKATAGAVVLIAVGQHVARTWAKLHAEGRSLQVAPAWVAVAVALYLVGLCGFGIFFTHVLRASRTPVDLLPAVRGYLISHLGKYVPGKAMVVVLRVALVVPYGARAATAAFATLYETLVMMAAGGLIAALGFAGRPGQPVLLALGLGLGLAFLTAAEPRVFPRLATPLRLPFPGVGPEALPALSHRLLAEGLLWSALGWTLLGLSQVAILRAVAPAGAPLDQWPLIVGSVALATVAGFVIAVVPGGLGVREGVLMVALAPAVGEAMAVVAALALRLAWVAGELLAAALLLVARPRPAEAPAP
jgi:glycosyltransferase 2 family protein